MKVICAGISKTGTKSIAKALRILGYNVYDLDEHWFYHLEEWYQILNNNAKPDFKKMYEGVDAVTDSPACFYFSELFAAFPDAKVILSVRETEQHWLQSFRKTVQVWISNAKSLRVILGFILTPTGIKWRKRMYSNHLQNFESLNQVKLESLLDGSDEWVKVYLNHNARVRATIPQDRLLVYQAKQGWKPICDFLGHDVPDISFPRENCGSESIPGMITSSSIAQKVANELNLILVILFGVLAVLCMLGLSLVTR